MPKKAPTAIVNQAGGVDLIVEKDAGNEILVSTGKKENSLQFWKELRALSKAVIKDLE